MPKRGIAKGVADGKAWFTRTQAARYMGITLDSVKGAQARGALQAVVIGGHNIFSRQTLDAYKAARGSADLATAAFALLDAGRCASELVSELKVNPDVALGLVESYRALRNAWLVAGPDNGTRSAWERTYQIGALTPLKLRRALELAARTPSLRARLLEE